MKPFAEEIFLQDIARQILGARRAISRLWEAIHAGNAEVAYNEVADFLNHAAVVSKILIPGEKVGLRATLRGQYLCKILGIDESEPALDRKLRNHLEHIDERLDKWISKNKSGVYIDGGLFPLASLLENVEAVRYIDARRGVYVFLGEEFHLNAIETSLEKIWDAATARGKVLKVPGHGQDPLRGRIQLPPDRAEKN